MPVNSDDPKPNILDDILRTTCAISLGAAQKGIAMAGKPEEALRTLVAEAQALMTVPKGTPGTLPDQAQALASVWLQQGTAFVMECKAAGEQQK